MQSILYDKYSQTFCGMGDEINIQNNLYCIYKNGRVIEYWAMNDQLEILNTDVELIFPEDFKQTCDKYKFDPENICFILNPDYVPCLEDRVNTLTQLLTQIQESQDNQDAILSAMIEMM